MVLTVYMHSAPWGTTWREGLEFPVGDQHLFPGSYMMKNRHKFIAAVAVALEMQIKLQKTTHPDAFGMLNKVDMNIGPTESYELFELAFTKENMVQLWGGGVAMEPPTLSWIYAEVVDMMQDIIDHNTTATPISGPSTYLFSLLWDLKHACQMPHTPAIPSLVVNVVNLANSKDDRILRVKWVIKVMLRKKLWEKELIVIWNEIRARRNNYFSSGLRTGVLLGVNEPVINLMERCNAILYLPRWNKCFNKLMEWMELPEGTERFAGSVDEDLAPNQVLTVWMPPL